MFLKMESKTACLILLTILLSCYISQTIARKQKEFISHIYKQKLQKKDAEIDTSFFNIAKYNSDEVEIYAQSDSLKANDKIEKLPGQPPVQFQQYGGYVTVNRTAGRAFYYYFVEAQHSDPKSLPLLLWLNGGPGCSSLGYGAMQELGPFRVLSDGKTLYNNVFSWNYAANVLFLESPAGVGFSYSNTTSDFKSGGDAITAIDNYAFLVNWLERFPEYKNREFYLSGESYAGHYVPQLAQIILYNNRKANNTIINLEGIIIGNAEINDETDTKGMYEYLGSHALVSEETTARIMKYCNFNVKNKSNECNSAIEEVNDMVDPIDPYNIYAPLCSNSSLTDKPRKIASSMTADPCGEDYVKPYLNNPEVQKALHANVTNIPYAWAPCSDVIAKWNDSPTTVIPLLKEFLASGLRVWIFSGDMDSIIPVTSTQKSIQLLNLPIKTPWHPWFSYGEVGGYTQVYEGNLTFATVRGAGHQVPSFQPVRALSLIMHFLSGMELPNSSRTLHLLPDDIEHRIRSTPPLRGNALSPNYSPLRNPKLSGRKIWPYGTAMIESMVPGSRSMRTACGTYLPSDTLLKYT